MRHPALVVALPFVVGLAAGGMRAEAVGFADLVLASAAAVVIATCIGGAPAPARLAAAALLATAAGGALGARDASLRDRPPLRDALRSLVDRETGEPISAVGVLVGDAQASRDGGAVLLVRATTVGPADGLDHLAGPSLIRVSVGGAPAPGVLASWREGSLVRMPLFLREPSTYWNPGSTDGALALARRGVALVATVKSASLVEVVRPSQGLDAVAADVRAWVRQTIAIRLSGRERAAAVSLAILIGDRTSLDDETSERLRRAGTFHVIAISGGNVALFTTACLVVFRGARVSPRLAAAGTMAMLAAYAAVVERGASVDRAVFVALVYLSARLVDHRASPLNVLGVAAMAIGLNDGAAPFDPGAQLTFAATFGLLVGTRPIALRLRRSLGERRAAVRRVLDPVCDALAANGAAELAVAPIAASVFGQVTAAGLVLNLVAVPAMGVVQFGGLLLLAVDRAPRAVRQACASLTAAASDVLVESASLVDVAPWLVVETPGARSYFAARIADAVPTYDTRRLERAPLRVTFLDVGQGDATLVRFPNGASLLVDAGGIAGSSFDMGRRVVVPALQVLGVRRLTWLALTHGDPDHVGGAVGVIDRLRPVEVWEGVPVPPFAPLARIHDAAKRARSAVRYVVAGDRLQVGGVELVVWHPPRPDWERQRVRNDDSIVVELRYGDVQVVLPGDVSVATENDLLPRLNRLGRVIVKAAHHGSRTSSSAAWVDSLSPDVVVYSAGRANRFGHPDPDVTRRFARVGARAFRTDLDGAVDLATDGVRVWAVSMSGRRVRLAPSS